MNTKEQAPHKPTVEYLKTFMYEHFATKEDLIEVEKRLNQRMDNLETKVDAGFNLILDTLARNGIK